MSSPTFAQNYIGEFIDDAAAIAQLATQGITLTTGMWYFNTTLTIPRGYDGAIWFSALRADGVVAMTANLDMGTNAITNVGLVDGVDVSAVGAASHARSHAITSATDHTSTATNGQMLQANANGLPVNATNTNAQVSATVTASHTRAHAMNSATDHSAATQGNIPYAGAAGAWALLAPGTAGQLLQTQGAGANPQWATAGQSQSIDFSQGSDTQSASTTNYYKSNSLDSAIAECEKPIVLSGSPLLKALVVNVTTNTRPNNTTFTVMKNGVATALVVTVPAAGTGAYSSTGSIASALGDNIAVRIVTGATAGTLSRSCAAVLITN